MEQTNKKTRVEYLFDIFKKDYNKGIQRGLFEQNREPGTIPPDEHYVCFTDPVYNQFAPAQVSIRTGNASSAQQLFDFLVSCDPTNNKEYVNWFLNLYRTTLKDRISIRAGYHDDLLMPESDRENFFEDLQTKAIEALETFTFLKKTNVLTLEHRDINRYKTINDFVNMVKPYMDTDEGDDSVHTLDHKELTCIRNFTEKTNKSGNAELVFQNEQWVIVVTHDQDANKEFGKYTTWCTASRSGVYGNMFDSYHGRGELFVLIRKGYGSKRAIKAHPNYRLQFHFEDGQYMDANDKSININTFLHENKEVKRYFRNYIVKTVLPKRQEKHARSSGRQHEDIKYLLNLGFGDEIIKIFKESMPATVDFSSHKIESEYLENIGEVTSIVELKLNDCGLTYLPESIKNLKNLKKLYFRHNPGITKIPDWVSELTELSVLDCTGCDIKEIGDLDKNINISELIMDINPGLTKLPKLYNLPKIERVTASQCNIQKITDEVGYCPKLYILDVSNNFSLTEIPKELSKLPAIVALCLDSTLISKELVQEMKSNSNGIVNVLYYD